MAEDACSAIAELGFGDFSPENLDDLLPKITTLISDESGNPNFLQLLNLIFNQLASKIEIESLDCRLLRHVLPPTKSAFENSLSEIECLLKESDMMDEEIAISISKSLQACLDILTGFGELLELLAQGSVQAAHVSSLNRTLPPILIDAFLHCKESENVYGVYFEESSSILTTFFKKSYEIQTKYYKALTENIVFTSHVEEDFDSLVYVMEAIVRMSEIVTSLDIKTNVDQWKVYTKLYSKYSSHLKNITDLSYPLCLLITSNLEIINSLSEHQENSPEKHQLKLLKIGNFLLKTIIRLCELCDCNFRSGWDELLGLLLVLHSCNKSYNLSQCFREELRRYVCIGAAPLLMQLLNEKEFYEAFHKLRNSYQDLTTSSKIGLLFLCLSIMKNVIDEKAPSSWNSISLVELLINLYDLCGLQFDLNSHFEGSESYTIMISYCAAFSVAIVDESSFANLETILVSKLFLGELHTSIFVSDILCLIGRLTSDEYCLHLATYLCLALNRWPTLSYERPHFKIIGLTVSRLWKLLSGESRSVLRLKFSSQMPHIHFWFGEPEQLSDIAVDKYVRFCEEPSVTSYISLMSVPPPMESDTCEITDGEKVHAFVSSIHKVFVYVRSANKNVPEFTWLLRLLQYCLKLLTACLKCGVISTDILDGVMSSLQDLIASCDEPSIELIVCNALLKSAELALFNPSETIVRSLSLIFIKLLSSEDKFIVSSCLMGLNALKTSSTLKDVVLLVSSHDQKLLTLINEHFNSNSIGSYSCTRSLSQFMDAIPRVEHSCKRVPAPTKILQIEPPATKKLKIAPTSEGDEELNTCLQKILSSTSKIKSLHSQFGLTSGAKLQLKKVIYELKSVCEDSGSEVDCLDEIDDIDCM